MRSPARETAACALLALLLPLAACTGSGTPDSSGSSAPGAAADAPSAGMDETLRDEALELLDAREEALVDGDRDGFLATVDPEALQFTATQARWFDNLAKLPVTDVSLELGDESAMSRVRAEGDLQLPVDFTMRLAGFDRRPVTQPMVYTFARDGDDVVLSGDRNVQMDARHDWVPAPWDITHIEVRRTGPILGIFDEDTEPYADYVMSDLAEARRAIRAFIPSWSGRFVAYDITDLQALDRMSPLQTHETAGVAFPVLERPGSKRVASYRFMVNADMADSVIERGFLFRHELVHVALGGVDDSSPTWLSEGIAEYASRAELPLARRQRISLSVLTMAGSRPLALRSGADFYRHQPTLNYELSNLVCDYLATTRGSQVLFDLVDAFAATRISTTVDVERVLRQQLGTDSRALTQSALDWAAS